MVGRDGVQNPVSLNSVLTNASRAVAGLLIATAGVGVRFLANPVSFAAVLVAPARIRAEALHPASAAGREAGQIRQRRRRPLQLTSPTGALVRTSLQALPGMVMPESSGCTW